MNGHTTENQCRATSFCCPTFRRVVRHDTVVIGKRIGRITVMVRNSDRDVKVLLKTAEIDEKQQKTFCKPYDVF